MVQNTILKIERDVATYTFSDFHGGNCSDPVLLICCTHDEGNMLFYLFAKYIVLLYMYIMSHPRL